MTKPIRIANCSGFFGDRLSAAREMVEGGPIDVLTGDWLAELTMLILARGGQAIAEESRAIRDPDGLRSPLARCARLDYRITHHASPSGSTTSSTAPLST